MDVHLFNFSPLAQIVYELCSFLSVKLIIERETDSVSFFLQTQLLMKISKSRKRAKQNFLSPKKLSKITFLKLCFLYVSSNFELIELYLFFQKIFWKSLTWTLKIFITETFDLENFQKTLRKSKLLETY